MLTKLLKICVRKWQEVEPDSRLPSPKPVSFPVYFNGLEVLEEQTGDSGSTGLWKGLGIHKFNTSSRRFLRSSKCRKCCFTSHGLLELRHIWPLSRQLVTTFRDLAEMRDGWRPYSHTNILPSMWYVSMKASLIANSTRNTNIYQRADRH